MTRTIKEEVHYALDAYFGEELANSDNEAHLRRCLYEPLVAVAEDAYKQGLKFKAGQEHVQMKLAQRRARAANKNCDRVTKEARDLRTKLFTLRSKVEGIAPHLRMILNIKL